MLFLKKKNHKNAEARTEIVAATLRVRGRRETCLVYAHYDDSSDAAAPPTCRNLRVRDLPGNLEPGDYPLEFNGVTLTLRIGDGQWRILDPETPVASTTPAGS